MGNFTVTVTPFQLSLTETWTTPKFNLGFNPTIVVSGVFSDLTDYTAVTSTAKTFATFDLANDILRVTLGHGASLGQRVKVSTSGVLPAGGLSSSYEYFLRPDVTNPTTDFTLHYTLVGAQNNTDRVDITDAGTGTHTVTYFTYETGAAMVFDAGSNTWQKGIVSPESLPEYSPATSTTPGIRGAVPAHEPGNLTDYLSAAGWTPFPALPDISGAGLFTYLNLN